MSHGETTSCVEGAVARVMRDKTIQIEWKIPKFLDLQHKGARFIDCPTALLSEAEWFIRIYPNFNESVFIYLQKKPSLRAHRASYSLAVLKVDGFVFKCDYSIKLFGTESCRTDVFRLSRPELSNARDVLSSDGTLTVLCSICLLDAEAFSMTDASCQTATSEGFDTLSKDFKAIFLNGGEGDVTFMVKDKKFLAHKLVLTTRSPVFRAMFKVDMIEKNNGTVDISDADPDHFEQFLLYLYSGELEFVSSSNAVGLYRLADKYNLQELKETCCKCLAREIGVSSLCDVALLAHLHNETELLETAKDFFTKHANAIFPTPKWLSFMAEHTTLANELLISMGNKFYGELMSNH